MANPFMMGGRGLMGEGMFNVQANPFPHHPATQMNQNYTANRGMGSNMPWLGEGGAQGGEIKGGLPHWSGNGGANTQGPTGVTHPV